MATNDQIRAQKLQMLKNLTCDYGAPSLYTKHSGHNQYVHSLYTLNVCKQCNHSVLEYEISILLHNIFLVHTVNSDLNACMHLGFSI